MASKMLEGEKYPSASAVISLIDQILSDLEQQEKVYQGDLKRLAQNLRNNLKKPNWFKDDAYKKTKHYNCLTFVNPCYHNMYMDTVKVKEQVFEDLKGDACYDEVANHVEEGVETQAQSQAETELESQSQSQGPGHSARRVELLARWRYIVPEAPSPIVRDFKTRLEEEIDMYSNEEPCGLQVSLCDWWRENRERFPLLVLYFGANSSFQATSTPSERVFNVDGLVMTKQRKNMNIDRQ